MPKVLIAEDDLLIADMVEEVLVDAGYEVCGIGRTVAEAVALGRRHRPDFAIIDMRLADNGIGTDIVVELGMLGRIGVLYATGRGVPKSKELAYMWFNIANDKSNRDRVASMMKPAQITKAEQLTRDWRVK